MDTFHSYQNVNTLVVLMKTLIIMIKMRQLMMAHSELPYYFVEIDSTDIFQNILIVADNERLEIGEEIAIYDYNGILTSECPEEFGEVLVGTGLFTGQDLNIRAIGGVQCDVYEQSTNAQPGFIQNNEIIVKVWRSSSSLEYTYSIAEQGYFFGGQDLVIDQFNIPLYYQVDIEGTENIHHYICRKSIWFRIWRSYWDF